MKIALLNSVILNGGDAGIVYGTIDAILHTFPAAEIVVYVHKAQEASSYYPDLNILPMLQDCWPAGHYASALMRKSHSIRCRLGFLSGAEKTFYRELKKYDLLVYCGGGYVNNLYSTAVLFAMMQKTLSLGVQHMAYAHSIGPFFEAASRTAASELLGQFNIVTVRDQASYDLLKRLNTSADNLFFTADAAFAMLPSATSASIEQRIELESIVEFKNSAGGSQLLFISARQWGFPGHPDAESLTCGYQNELRRFVGRVLNETNWRICFISTCQGRGSYNFDDASYAEMLVAALSETLQQRIHVSHANFHPRFYPELISSCADMVITMRMHFMIYSIIAGLPVIPLAYEQKSIELARQVGVDNYCHEVATLNADSLFDSFVSMQVNNAMVRNKVKEGYITLKNLSLENCRILQRHLESAGSQKI